jgi:hypothetical protein
MPCLTVTDTSIQSVISRIILSQPGDPYGCYVQPGSFARMLTCTVGYFITRFLFTRVNLGIWRPVGEYQVNKRWPAGGEIKTVITFPDE